MKIKDNSWFISNELPEGLVLFSSTEGRRIFFETETAGYLNSYFELSQNLLTSFEPRFSCGLATLTMCMNTFREDPGRIWKDIYRHYAQTMLQHCVPYRILEYNGLAFQQFACMAECNHLNVDLVCNVKPTASIGEFRALCKRVTSGCCEEILVVCYHRIGLDQQGTGHFSPIGAYHPEKDLVLVFDVSRYKYPLHWVPLTRLWEAMELHDDVTGNPRGYFLLSKRTRLEKPVLLFKTVGPDDSPYLHKGWWKFYQSVLMPWHCWMHSLDAPNFNTELLKEVARKLLIFMLSSECPGLHHLDGIHIRFEFKNSNLQLKKSCLVCSTRETIEETGMWKVVKAEIVKLKQEIENEQRYKLQQQHQEQHEEDDEQQRQHNYEEKQKIQLRLGQHQQQNCPKQQRQQKQRLQEFFRQPQQVGQQHQNQETQQHQKQQKQEQPRLQQQAQQQQHCLCWSKLINDVSESKPPAPISMCCDVLVQPSTCHLRHFNLAHYMVMILLSWPYGFGNVEKQKNPNYLCSAMDRLVSTEVSNITNEDLKDELLNARSRFLRTHLTIQKNNQTIIRAG